MKWMGGLRAVYLWPVLAYQRWVSPRMPMVCRFQPTCSCYFVEAVHKKGIVVGTWRGLWRIVRCQPFCKGGFDPVD